MKALSLTTVCALYIALAACSSAPTGPAPVVERSVGARSTASASAKPPAAPLSTSAAPTKPQAPLATPAAAPVGSASSSASASTSTSIPTPTAARPSALAVPAAALPTTLPQSEGKVHVVKKGDTLYSIALDNGLAHRELAAWNGVSNPAQISIDQRLRLTPPGSLDSQASSGSPSAVLTPPAAAMPAPVANTAAATMSSAPKVPLASVPTTAPVAASTTPTAASQSAAQSTSNEIVWQWPTSSGSSKLSAAFVDGKSKGVDLIGKMGDPIVAAADGKVVYSGNALKGYGQMLVIKHSDVYLTAYAHNSLLLVKDDEVVKRGQKIALMGNSESDKGVVKLHFELRRSGKPVDPAKILPPLQLPPQ